ncbi:hypothetical protein [Kribbella sp. NPDC048928]|uniref:hypothetical protein n=1 Tax=Kribbella sp. NPDC048928 TaxID=3364111 RepID=UPI00371BDB01
MPEQFVTGRAAYDALHDPNLIPPPAAGGPPGSLAWLRSAVPRFAAGAVHAARRGLVLDALEEVDTKVLRRRARERTSELARCADVDRVVVVGVLAEALGVRDLEVAPVRTVAAVYLSGADDPAADVAVAQLVTAFGGVADERTAARISVLVQACEATAALIGKARPALRTSVEVDALLRSIVHSDPPVRSTIRQTVTAPDVLRIDLAGSELPFGAGTHACPGREQAFALAAGVCEALLADC